MGIAGVGAGAIDRALPVIVAGFGPGGASAAIDLRRAGIDVIAFEGRGAVANRARSISVRPQTREIFHEQTGGTLRASETIMDIENPMRRAAEQAGTQAHYGHQVLSWTEEGDRVRAVVQDTASGRRSTIEGAGFINATGGRLAEGSGPIASNREYLGTSHVYVTAQFRDPIPTGRMSGVYDQQRQDLFALLPVGGPKDGFVAYLDLKPGQEIGDEAALVDRFEKIAGNLGFGAPVSRPQAFDAQQFVARDASSRMSIDIGNSVGVADPYIGAGVAAAFVDARHAARAFAGTKGTLEERLAGASRDAILGHRMLATQAQAIVDMRHLAWSLDAKNVPLEQAVASDIRPIRLADRIARALMSRPVYDGSPSTYGAFLETAGASVGGRVGAALGAAYMRGSSVMDHVRSPLAWLTRAKD